jgi:2-polyprenyl-3-methyl-5-hydroxy-6-metoxy-1,4-benzoquinol methylase
MDFNEHAATWDNEPRRVKLANDVASAILKEVALSPEIDVLDFGCGTGLLTLRLQPAVRTITGADTSDAMLEILASKIQDRNLEDVRTMLLDHDVDTLSGTYHLVVSNMTLHHVEDVPRLLTRLRAVLAPHGQIALTDLDPEGGRFHESHEGIHHFGFAPGVMRKWLIDAGFDDIRERTAATLVKKVVGGAEESFTVFLVVGRRSD